MTRKDDKGDQPNGGETTWTNTGATRYGRGKHKTGKSGDIMLRPSPNHRTQRLPIDDDDDHNSFWISDYSRATELVALSRTRHLLWLCDLTVDVVLDCPVHALFQRSVDNERDLVIISGSIEQQQSTSKQNTHYDLHEA